MLPGALVVDPSLLARHAAAHEGLYRAIMGADPRLRRMWRRHARERMAQSIARVAPVLSGVSPVPDLFPPPRAFLSARERERTQGCRAAVAYVDGEHAARPGTGGGATALAPEAPYVLHALCEGPVHNPQVSNPGMIRAGEVTVPVGCPAPASRCRALLEEAVAIAARSDAPAVVRAAWLNYATVVVHPFVDGNGRVSTLLFMLLAGDDLPAGIDWGVAEMLRHDWAAFEAARFAGHPEKDGWEEGCASPDPAPQGTLMIEKSAAGAELGRRRLDVMHAMVDELCARLDIRPDGALAILAVWLRRVADAGTLAEDLGSDYAEVLDTYLGLVSDGRLERVIGSPRALGLATDRPVFGMTAPVAGVLRELAESPVR